MTPNFLAKIIICHIIKKMVIKILSSLFFIFLALFPFGQLTKIPLGFLNLPEVHLYLADIVLFFLILVWGSWRFLTKKKKYKLPPLAKPIFSFVLIGGISLIVNSLLFSGRELGIGFLYLLRWFFYAVLYFVLMDLKNQFNWLNWENGRCFLIIIGSAVGFFALIQYFLWPNLKALEVLHYDPHFYRAVGTFLDPGFTGIILVLTLILISNNIFNESSQKIFDKKSLAINHYLLFLILYLVLALTYSRASWLAFFISMTLLSVYKKSWKLFLLVVGVLTLTLIFIPRPTGEGGKLSRTYTIQARIKNTQQALKIIREKPFFGVGFNTLRYYQKSQGFLDKENWQLNKAGAGLDNSWLFLLATTGIFGFFTYLWLWGKIVKNSQRNFLVLISLSALLTHSFFLNSLFYPWVMAWLWLLLSFSWEKFKENK